MFSGIISIALAHGLILTPALWGECWFIYSKITHREQPNNKDLEMDPVESKSETARHPQRYQGDLGQCAVIGGNGFLGCHLVQRLAEKGHPVRVLDIHQTLDHKLISIPDVEYRRCDITNRDDVYRGLQGINTIFHCASVIDIRLSPSPMMHDVNVNGTANILSFCNHRRQKGNVARNLVYVSTLEVYTDTERKGDALRNMKEESVVSGASYRQKYGETKAAAEQMVLSNKKHNDRLKVAAVRPGLIFGPHSPILVQVDDTRIPLCHQKAPIAVQVQW